MGAAAAGPGPGTDEVAVAERALALGVKVYPLGDDRFRHRPDDRPGVVLGYGSLAPGLAEEGVRRPAEVLRDPAVSRPARGRAGPGG